MLQGLFLQYLGRPSLIAADDTWALLAVLCVSVAACLCLEGRYRWASKISGGILALLLGLLLSNLGVLPVHSGLYDDVIWGFAVPLSIPMLLQQCSLQRVRREAGQMLLVFLTGAAGTVLGALLGFFLLRDHIPELAGVAAMMTGTYIGGSVNFTAMAGQFDVSQSMVGAATVADNLLMALYFFALILFAGLRFFRARFPHPHIDEAERVPQARNQAASFWGRKDISLRDIAANLAYAAAIVLLSQRLGALLGGLVPDTGLAGHILHTFLSSQYVWITTFSMLAATFAGERVSSIHGGQELGTYLICLFLFAVGVPASVAEIVTRTPLLFVFAALMVLMNMVFCFVGGWLIRADLEDIIIASNANIGGPATAAGMAISQGWSRLVGPGLLVGVLGYVIGNYAGTLIGALLGA